MVVIKDAVVLNTIINERICKKREIIGSQNVIKLYDVTFKNTDIEFYPRVINEANLTFSSDELPLNQILKHTLHYEHKNWTKTSALESEADICHLIPSILLCYGDYFY
jgi:hypothetical protein